jgi:outer membrane protein insertion porin family
MYSKMDIPVALLCVFLGAGLLCYYTYAEEGESGQSGRSEVVWIKGIDIKGNTVFSDKKIKRMIKTSKRGWIPFLKPGRFEEEKLQNDLWRIEREYHNAGYLDARAAGYRDYDDNFSSFLVRIVIYEGPLYRVGDIRFEGNRLFREDELQGAIPLKSGEVFQAKGLDQAKGIIADMYGRQGYVDVRPGSPALQEELYFAGGKENRVDVTFRIKEGDPVFIDKIQVEGLTKTNELVVLRNLTFEPGDRANVREMRQSERSLRDTGFFDLTSPNSVDISLAPGESQKRDAVVRVEEGLTGRLMLGGGIGSEDGRLGTFYIQENNFDIGNWPSSWKDLWSGNAFRGGGQKMVMNIQAGTEESSYMLSFSDPSVRNSDYSFGASIFSTIRSWEEFDLSRTGLRTFVGKRYGEYVSRKIELGYESIEMEDVDSDVPPEIRKDDDIFHKPYVAITAARDTRDSTMLPSEGYRLEITGEVGFADIETISLTGSAEKYWTTLMQEDGKKHILSLRGKAGIIDSYTDERIPVFSRFYAGGLGSLRGFEWHGVSPVEPVSEEQVGGESMLLGSAEYSIPLFGENFRFVGFVDAGYVEEDASDLFSGWDKLRVSPGIGCRYMLPALGGIPLSIDLAFPIMDESEDETRTFHFTFGLSHGF